MKGILWLTMGIALCALAGAVLAAERAERVVGFFETFERPEALQPALGTLSKEWEVGDGVLRTSKEAGAMPGLALGDETCADTDIEFRIRVRRERDGKDNHFGLILRKSDAGALQFYCRKDRALLLETSGKATLRHVSLGYFKTPLDFGEAAAFHTFRVLCRGPEAKVWMDGHLAGEAADLVPTAGTASFYAYNLDVALDDLCVTLFRSATAAEPAAPLSPNVAPNSSFEHATEPGLADYWGCPHWGLMDPDWVPRFEEWARHFGVDDRVAFDGRRSMRIVNPDDKPTGSGLQLRSCVIGTRHQVPYVLSAYLRSDPPAVRVKLGGISRQREFTLSGDWQRCSLPFLNEKGLYEDTVNLCVQSKGTVWIDAVQLEEGEAPTAYTPSTVDRQLSAALALPASAEAAPPEISLPVAAASPVLDGDPSDPCWKTAVRVGLKSAWGGEPSEPAFARLVSTATGVYLHIECVEKAAAANRCRVKEFDGPVRQDPSIEIFLSPCGDDRYYYLAVNQEGTVYDAANDDASWNAPWMVATRTRRGAWEAHVFLPFGVFAAEASGNTAWGLNICRNNPGAGERSAWSPTYGGFHKPDRFGRIRLDGRVLDAYRFAVEDVRLLPNPDRTLSLECRLRNLTTRTADLALQVTATADGRTVTAQQAVRLEAGSSRLLALPLAGLGDAGRAACELRLSDRRGGTLRHYGCATVRVALPDAPEVLPQFRIYTGEKEMRVRVRQEGARRVAVGKVPLTQLEVFVEDPKRGKCVARRSCAASPDGAEVAFEIRAWPNGEYRIHARPSSGGVIATAGVVKAPPLAHEVKVDRFRRLLLVDGKVFIPTAIDWEGELTPEIIAYLGRRGINTIFVNAYGMRGPDAGTRLRALLDQAQAAGVRLIIGQTARDEGLKALRVLIPELQEHPALLAWCIFDEVFTIPWGRGNYETVAATCRELRDLSPYRPVYLNENGWGISYLHGKGLDFPGEIVSIDHYAYPPAGDLPVTLHYVRMMEQMGRAEGKPLFLFVLGAGYAFGASRDHTPAEHDYLAYGALIHGARGLLYFASHPKSRSAWERIQGICREVKELTPVLSTPGEPESVACSAASVSLLARRVEGKLYLIAVNNAKAPVAARFDLAALAGTAPSQAEVLFESRRVPLKEGCIEDEFAGFGRHVYVVEPKAAR